ncbi:MAG TPA: alpha-L-fucosidase [Polyangia bacterium]|nr:alpha-L-fucosidase [Polyangia bacterium]
MLSSAPIVNPDPVAPLPSAAQLAWQTQELTAFLHFGVDTFSGKEQGDGTDSPAIFNPTALDAGQWMTTLRTAGFRQAMLTAKHHDGFCLWPTKCTPYSVTASPWMGGQGDVVGQFVQAAHEANIRVGLALSPNDRHETSLGTLDYQAVFNCQLTELLSNYGTIDEIWLWDDNGTPASFNFAAVHDLVRRLQPDTLVDVGNVTASVGADLRSVGTALPTPDAGAPDQTSVKPEPGNTTGMLAWYPAEAVYGIRPGWFWHAAEDTQLKSLGQLIDVYYNSVGRNSVLLLNVPPNTQGVLAAPDVAELTQFGADIRDIYRQNLAAARPAVADSVFKGVPVHAAALAVDGSPDTYWAAGQGTTSARLEIDLGGPQTFNVVNIQEPIALGERTTAYHVEVSTDGPWVTIASGTSIGERNLLRVGTITASSVALVITQARGAPAIAEFGVYLSPFL